VDCWIVDPQGLRRKVGTSGLLIGRGSDCDLILGGSDVSRRHALVRLSEAGVEVVVVGASPVLVSGETCSGRAPLNDGDSLVIGSVLLAVSISGDGGERDVDWVLSLGSGVQQGVRRSPFFIGGSASDDLVIEDWPPSALRLQLAGNALVASLEASAEVDGVVVVEDAVIELDDGSTVKIGDRELSVTRFSQDEALEATTRPPSGELGVSDVRLRFLPRGGRVQLRLGNSWHSLVLSDRSFDLLATLVQPPDATPGDFVSDDVVFRRVWGADESDHVRERINVLLLRTRRALTAAGLNGPALVQRSSAGRATRFAVLEEANVVVE